MSIETIVFLNRERMPTAADWADAIHRAGFPADLDRVFEPFTMSGFLPCRYDGDDDSGFEYFLTPAAELKWKPELSVLGDRDSAASFITHSGTNDLLAATVAAATLAEMSGGLLYDSESGHVVPAESSLAWARKEMAGMSAENSNAHLSGTKSANLWRNALTLLLVAMLVYLLWLR